MFKYINKFAFAFLFAIVCSSCFSQSQGSVLVIVDSDSKLSIDGGSQDAVTANVPKKYVLSLGEHLIQITATLNGANTSKSQVVTIEADKQKVVQIELSATEQKSVDLTNSVEGAITVADLNFTIPGTFAVNSWKGDHPNQAYPNSPDYFYAFEKGDEIVIDCGMTNKKGTNVLVVSTFPGKSVKYSNQAFTDLSNIRIKVEERSIYRFALATNFAFDRNGKMTIKRIPASEATKNFNSTVKLQKKYKAVTILSPQDSWVNSGSNAAMGGKSRITFPVEFPQNTVEWYYKFAASRDANLIAQTKEELHLVGELTKLVGGVTGGVLNIAVNQLTQPPGSNYCDVILLDKNNFSPFEQKVEYSYIKDGSRENFTSGVVQMKCCTNDTYYLGVRNPDSFYGIQVAIEVVAIVLEEGLAMEQED
jgi:hypothetical protein